MTSSPAMLVRFRPAGPWRFGPDDGARERVDAAGRSDTVFSALCAALAALGERERWLAATVGAEEPAVRLSSLFPFQGRTLLAPPPRSFWPPHGAHRLRFQAAQFAPLGLIHDLIREQPIREDRYEIDPLSGCVIAAGGQSPFRTVLRSAAAIDRWTGSAEPHQTACLEFNQGAGLWLAAEFAGTEAREAWAKPLRAAFRLLGDTGIGGERSRGWGRSEAVEIEEGSLGRLLFGHGAAAEDPAATGYWLLSLYSPAESDGVDWSRGDYRLRTRAGRIESPAGHGAEKRAQRVVTEGSVVVAARPPRGAAHDVAPAGFAHPVYRAGFAVAVPVTWKAAADRPLTPIAEPEPEPEPVPEPPPVIEAAPAPEPESDPVQETYVEGEGI